MTMSVVRAAQIMQNRKGYFLKNGIYARLHFIQISLMLSRVMAALVFMDTFMLTEFEVFVPH